MYTEQSSDYITTSGPSGVKNITLSDSISNYDYIYITMVGIASTVIRPEANNLIKSADCDGNNYFYLRYGSGNVYFIEGYITPSATTTIGVEGYWGTGYTGVKIISVTGIKYIDPDIKNVTSLDETLLYSGNDPITATTGSTGYTLNDDITNFDYIIIEVEGNQPNSTNPSITKMCSSYQLESNIVNYSYSIGEHRGDNYTCYFDGWVTCATSEGASTTTIKFALRDKTSNINSVILKSVIGIKKNSLSTADIAEMAMPSDVYTTLTLDSNNNVEAPADGYIAFSGNTTNAVNNITISIVDSNNVCIYARRISVVPTNIGTFDTMAIRKGAFANIDYNNVQNVSIKFIYSIGSAKALGLL